MRRHPWLPIVGAFIGVGLLLGALVMVWRQRDVVAEALASIADLPASQRVLWVMVMIAMVVANLVCSAVVMSLLIARTPSANHRRAGTPRPQVGWLEMQALIAASTLLNFIPLRPGLLGRVAYHRAYNHVPVSHSAKVVVQTIALSVICGGYAVGALIIIERFGSEENGLHVPVIIAPLALIATWLMNAAFMRRSQSASKGWMASLTSTDSLRLIGATGVRYIELLTMAVRYYIAFGLIGSPIDIKIAVALACVSAASNLVPFLSNGLGLREWAIGAFATALTPHRMSLGITADLLNRAVELVVFALAGLAGLAYLGRLRGLRNGSERVSSANNAAP